MFAPLSVRQPRQKFVPYSNILKMILTKTAHELQFCTRVGKKKDSDTFQRRWNGKVSCLLLQRWEGNQLKVFRKNIQSWIILRICFKQWPTCIRCTYRANSIQFNSIQFNSIQFNSISLYGPLKGNLYCSSSTQKTKNTTIILAIWIKPNNKSKSHNKNNTI